MPRHPATRQPDQGGTSRPLEPEIARIVEAMARAAARRDFRAMMAARDAAAADENPREAGKKSLDGTTNGRL